MEIFFLIVAGIVVYFVISKGLKNSAVANDGLDAIAKSHGLNFFYRCYVYDGIVGLDDTQNVMVWVSKTDKSAFKILRSEDVRRVQHEKTPSHNNTTKNKIVFTTNDVRNPTVTLEFGLGTKPAEDFYQRIGILFNLS